MTMAHSPLTQKLPISQALGRSGSANFGEMDTFFFFLENEVWVIIRPASHSTSFEFDDLNLTCSSLSPTSS